MSDLETITNARHQFEEQIDFFRRKLNLPSETWRDIQRAAHDRAFMVAGAMKADRLPGFAQRVPAPRLARNLRWQQPWPAGHRLL